MYGEPEYIESPRIIYGEGAQFIRACPKCGRFVKPDEEILFGGFDEQPKKQPNATCKKCGRVEMPFEGYYDFTFEAE